MTDAKGLSEVVTRYQCSHCSHNDFKACGNEPNANGNLVLYADYAALAERLKDLEAFKAHILEGVERRKAAGSYSNQDSELVGDMLYFSLVKTQERLKACEELIEGDKHMDALLWKKLNAAAAAIKSEEQWPDNAWPSPNGRCWYVAAKERIDQLTADLAAARAEVERLTDTIRREAWLEQASAKDVPGPYVPWAGYARLRVALEDIRKISFIVGNETHNNPTRECGAIAKAALTEPPESKRGGYAANDQD